MPQYPTMRHVKTGPHRIGPHRIVPRVKAAVAISVRGVVRVGAKVGAKVGEMAVTSAVRARTHRAKLRAVPLVINPKWQAGRA
jgi:hypothetical protein